MGTNLLYLILDSPGVCEYWRGGSPQELKSHLGSKGRGGSHLATDGSQLDHLDLHGVKLGRHLGALGWLRSETLCYVREYTSFLTQINVAVLCSIRNNTLTLDRGALTYITLTNVFFF